MKIVGDFSLFSVAIVEVYGTQYAINARHLDSYIHGQDISSVEAIPWGELIGRKVTSASLTNGYLTLSFSTRGGDNHFRQTPGQIKPRLDLKETLTKYIGAVIEHEGVDFTEDLDDSFTEEERLLLRKLAGH